MTSQISSHYPPRRARHIVVANYSGYILGDDAIFEALLPMIHRACGPAVVVDALTAMPERTRRRYPMAEINHIYGFLHSVASRSQVIAMIARADLLLIGGGDIIEGQQALLLLTMLAALAGTPVAFVGVGVIRPAQSRRRLLLRWTSNAARYIATRDAESKRLLATEGVRRPILQTLPDLAVALVPTPERAEDVVLAEGIHLQRPYIAVNVRPPELTQYGTAWGDAAYDALAHVCRAAIDSDGMAVVCVPFICEAAHPPLDAGTPSDDRLMLDLARRIDRADRVHVLRADYRPAEVAAVLRDADVAIGMRLHFLILAASAGTPVVALSYARKVRAFMSSIDLDHFCLDIEEVDAATLGARVVQARAEHELIATHLTAWCQSARADLATIEERISGLAGTARPLKIVRQLGAQALARLGARALAMYSMVRKDPA